jgi:hypothetical protein
MIKFLWFSVFLTTFVCLPVVRVVQKTPFAASSFQRAEQRTPAAQILIDESRKAIIETGLSDSYFDSHFKILRVENTASDRRVIWQITINGYEAVITDAIGYYTAGLSRVYTHSVKQTLGRTSEIVKTIPRTRALALMTKCVGAFTEPSVQFGPVEGTAQLLLVAHKKQNLSRREREEREQRETRERERERKGQSKNSNKGTDQIENAGEEEGDDPVVIGYINLQTGKCTKGKGVLSP